ncbi:peptidoglycan D,D-transpeptidase FtsI family protein [Radicibacter daui]|uniref:peptidoglycan D,D-transpeptidase FtsI family protein n=1 Tax=Radicibacter daui TaxID=3064829 RepID=UPI004046BA47
MTFFNPTSPLSTRKASVPGAGGLSVRILLSRLALWLAGGVIDARRPEHANAVMEQSRGRAVMVGFMMLVAFSIVAVRLVDVMLLRTPDQTADEADVSAPAVADASASPVVPAPAAWRADITDRNGGILATTISCPSMYADPVAISDPVGTTNRLMQVLPSLDYSTTLARLTAKGRMVWVERHLTPTQRQTIHDLGLPGIDFRDEPCRLYPTGNLASHIVGYTNIDQVGQAGLEKQFDKFLNDGQPVELSLDMRLQHILRRELQANVEQYSAVGGSGIVMDIYTGELLAMVSLPDFDPNERHDPNDEALFNRNTLGRYELGSVFKIFNTALALESGKVKLSDTFDTAGPVRIGRFTIHDFHPVNYWMNVPEIFEKSSNIGSLRMVQVVGRDLQQRFLGRLGMTRPATLELPELANVTAPPRWGEVESWTISYGHGIAVTPLHLVAGVSAMVNGGTLVTPTLLKQTSAVPVGQRIIAQKTSDTVRRLMRLVVTGGAGLADAPGYLVGGKTGTAEKATAGGYAHKALISSFIGAFPITKPRYVVFVMLDEPQGNKSSYGYATGGWVAAPVVSRLVAQMGPLYGLPPESEDDPAVRAALALSVPPTNADTGAHGPQPHQLLPAPDNPDGAQGGATLVSF